MKRSSYLPHCFFVTTILFVTVFASCKKHVLQPAGSTNTLLQQINTDPHLLLLSAALNRTNMDTIFSGGGPFTFFAPVDSAFVNAGFSLDRINQMDADSLKTIISYHILYGRVSTDNILGFLREKLASLDPAAKPFIIKNYDGIFINGIHVDHGNIACADGVLHEIGEVSVPPPGNLYTTILQEPDLTYYAYILQSNLSFPGANYPYTPVTFASLLNFAADSFYFSQNSDDQSGDGNIPKPEFTNFTLLLPSDAAFRSAGLTLDSINGLMNSNPLQLASILLNGVECGEYFTSDFLTSFYIDRFSYSYPIPNTYRYSFLQNDIGIYGPLIFGIKGNSVYYSNKSYGFGNATFLTTGDPIFQGKITRPDVIATNGVIQIMDSVLTHDYVY